MNTPLHAEPVVTVLNTTFHGNNLDGKPVIGGGPDGQTRLTLIGWTCFGPDEAGQAALYTAAAPAPDGLREAVWQAVMLGGDAWGITDRVIALLAAAPAHEGKREAVEIVTEWLAMAEAVPTQTHGVLRYPPTSRGELDAIALLAKGGGT
jgi:hypothetical protein